MEMESSAKSTAEPEMEEEPRETGKANMETEKEEKPSSVSGGESRKKKTYQKIRDDKQEWNRIQRARLRHGLPLQSWPPTTEVKQEEEEEAKTQNNQEGLAAAVGSSACSSSSFQISTTVLSPNHDGAQALTPGRIEGHLERIGHRPLSKAPVQPGAVKRGPMQ